ncbi:MAG: EMC3/TMCO1 family protein [Candidatus Aenigmatarchaeota archaeon]
MLAIFSDAVCGVAILALAISFVISAIYKVFTDEKRAKKIKENMDELKEKAEKAREDGKHDKANEHMSEMMKHSSKQMKMQLKPMAITFIVIIPLFWFVFPNLYPPATVNFNQNNTLSYKGTELPTTLEDESPVRVNIDGKEYERGDIVKTESWKLEVGDYNEEDKILKLERIAVMLPFSLPMVGNSLGWLGWYILIALASGQVFRKLLGVVQ